MNLRNRSLLVLGLTFFAFFIIIAAVSFSVTLSGLDRIEYEDLGDAMNQSRSAIHSESVTLLGTAQDWAWWDEMYQFAVSHTLDFIDRNAAPDNMATIRVHLFMVMDDHGDLIYGRILSPDFQTNETVPDEIVSLIRNNPRLDHLTAENSGTSGLLLLPGGPMIIAATPILKSDNSGPAHGTLIMGRYFNHGPLQRIDEITGYSTSLTLSGSEAAGGYPPTPPPVTGPPPGTVPRIDVISNESMITGSSRERDLAGNEMILRVTMERVLHRIGIANISTYLFLLALWGIMTCFIVVIVMDRTVLQRLGRLTGQVRSFSHNPDKVPVPVLSGNDELAELEKTILVSRADLLLSEQQLRVFVDAMPGPAALFSRDEKFLLLNTAFAGYLNKSVEEVKGMDIRSYIPPGQIQKYERFVDEAIQTKKPVHFENELLGKTYLMSYYPVLDHDGEVIQLGLLSFDISERKRLENALQRVTKKISLLNTVIFTDIQNKVFVQMGYLELARQTTPDTRQKTYLEKQEDVVKEIQSSLSFARQFNDMGMNPPRWQNVQEVILFAVSHLDLGSLTREFSLEGIEIYADPLLERVFVTLVENTILHAPGATVIRAGYTITGDEAVIVVEDNGPGIAGDKKESVFVKGIGAGGSTSLFLSREILSITGITIRETGVSGKGVRFEIRVPKGSYRISSK